MNFFRREVCGLAVFVAVLVGFSALSRAWLKDSFPPTDPLDGAVAEPEEQPKSEQISSGVQVLMERGRVKDRVVGELLAGKITLLEAAAWFRSLYEEPGSWPNPRSPRPRRDEGERWCRLVIDWAVAKTAHDKSAREARAARQRLEDELQEHLHYQRTVVLPD
jgi:hypothetical protein